MSTSIIRFHAFSGAQSSDPPCYLLQIDEFHFLLDCGVDEGFNLSGIEEVKKYAKVIDAILLTHPDPHHLGALPYLVGKCGLNCPVYATTPVYKMGQLFMYDIYQSKFSGEEFQVFSLDDVDAAFDLFVQVKFHQTINLHGKGQGLTITALPAGHMLGGTMWKIMKDDTDIVYAIDYNHKKERHLNGAAFDSCLRPHLLIADAGNALYTQSRRRTRDEQLMKSIMQTLRRGGNVLLAVDTAGRCLEIAHLLEQLWHNQESGLMAYGLALLNHVAFNVIEFAKSQVEWMSDKVMRTFEDQRTNPFNFRHMQLCHAMDQLDNVSQPKVVLASQADLQNGFSRDVFLKWCDNEKNLVILTQRCSTGTLAQNLYDDANLKSTRLDVGSRVRLVGEELEEYLEKKRMESGAGQDTAGSFFNGAADLDASASGLPGGLQTEISMMEQDEDSSDDELMDTALTTGTARMDSISGLPSKNAEHHSKHGPTFDITIGTQPHSGGPWFKAAKKTQLLFPYNEKKRVWDEYGEKVSLTDFIGHTGSSDGAVVTIVQDDKPHKEETAADVTSAAKIKKAFTDSRGISSSSGHGNTHHQTVSDLLSGEVPTKCITETKEISIKCGVYFIDFEGRSDGEAMKKILSSFRPQEIILVRGSPKATNQLAEYCRTNMHLSPDLIHTPCVGDTIDCTKEGFIYQARMKDSLVSSLNFFKIRDYELSWIDADVIIEHNVCDPKDANDGDDDHSSAADETVPVLVPPEGKVQDHATVLVNEPKLSDVKQILINHGMNAEFLSGVLVIDNCVAIKRSEAGKFLLEGTISDTYFNVMKSSLDKVLVEARQLASRMKERDETADLLMGQASYIQSRLEAMKQYQAEVISLGSVIRSASRQPVFCLTPENNELRNLRSENEDLKIALEEHQATLELIMTKYRDQVSKLMHNVESNNGTVSNSGAGGGGGSGGVDISSEDLMIGGSDKAVSLMMDRLSEMMRVVRQISTDGDVHSSEMEALVQQLLTENEGLRNLLKINQQHQVSFPELDAEEAVSMSSSTNTVLVNNIDSISTNNSNREVIVNHCDSDSSNTTSDYNKDINNSAYNSISGLNNHTKSGSLNESSLSSSCSSSLSNLAVGSDHASIASSSTVVSSTASTPTHYLLNNSDADSSCFNDSSEIVQSE